MNIKYKLLIALLTAFSLNVMAKSNTKLTIDSIIKAHSESTDFHQWDDHKLNPKKQIPRLIKQNTQDLCHQLSQISTEDLSLFYNALLQGDLRLRCKTELIQKIEAFYTPQIKIEGHRPFWRYQAPIAKTDVLEIDPRNGGLYIYADLPKKHIALTFDDGPHSRLTGKLLKILKQREIKATFFMLGKQSLAYPNAVLNVEKDGHSIANHTHSHKNLRSHSRSTGVNEIEKGFTNILKTVDQMTPFFRFPYGAYTKSLRNYLNQNDFPEFFWSVDTLDWKYKNHNTLLKYALKQTKKANRGIVLFHDVQPQTIAIMPQYLDSLIKDGYTFVNLISREDLKARHVH